MSHAAAPAPAAAPAAAAPAGPPKDPVGALAEEIFIRFVSRAMTLNGTEPQLNGNAESYARLAHKLAETYRHVMADIKEKNAPTAKAFDVNAFDFDSWTKAPAAAGAPADATQKKPA